MRFQTRIGMLVASLVLFAVPAHAVYNANMIGIIEDVLTYSDGDYVYFRLQNQPTSHPTCNPAYFVFTESVPAARLNRLLARLLTAKASGESVNIGYDNTGDCAHGYMRAHRVG